MENTRKASMRIQRISEKYYISYENMENPANLRLFAVHKIASEYAGSTVFKRIRSIHQKNLSLFY